MSEYTVKSRCSTCGSIPIGSVGSPPGRCTCWCQVSTQQESQSEQPEPAPTSEQPEPAPTSEQPEPAPVPPSEVAVTYLAQQMENERATAMLDMMSETDIAHMVDGQSLADAVHTNTHQGTYAMNSGYVASENGYAFAGLS